MMITERISRIIVRNMLIAVFRMLIWIICNLLSLGIVARSVTLLTGIRIVTRSVTSARYLGKPLIIISRRVIVNFHNIRSCQMLMMLMMLIAWNGRNWNNHRETRTIFWGISTVCPV